MADKEDDLVVNVDDLDTVTVDVTDDATLIEPETKEAKPVKEPKPRRVKPESEQAAVIQAGPTPEEALQQAQTFGKQQEEARKAAEATAANERSLREQAQRQASQAQEQADQYKEQASNSQLAIIENGIASATQQIDSYKEEYVRAAEAGEFAKMGDIQTKLSKAAAALDRLETTKSSFDVNTKLNPTTEGRVEAPIAQQSPFEKYLGGFSPVAQNWLRLHPDCAPAQVGGDSFKNSKMMQGHYAAVGKNIQEGSAEYFKTIEEYINPTEVQPVIDPAVASKASEVQGAGTETKVPKHVQPSAPVSRDAPAANGQPQRNVREVRLTKDQQEMAKVSFPHLPENQAFGQYARNLIELEAEGKIGRLTH